MTPSADGYLPSGLVGAAVRVGLMLDDTDVGRVAVSVLVVLAIGDGAVPYPCLVRMATRRASGRSHTLRMILH